MAVKIRLTRTGRRNRPHFRIAVMDGRTRRDGRCIEILGTYDPLVKDVGESIALDRERTEYWLSQGAQVSETVASFLRRKEIGEPGRPRKPRRKRSRKKKQPEK